MVCANILVRLIRRQMNVEDVVTRVKRYIFFQKESKERTTQQPESNEISQEQSIYRYTFHVAARERAKG